MVAADDPKAFAVWTLRRRVVPVNRIVVPQPSERRKREAFAEGEIVREVHRAARHGERVR
ncbi:MAG: hypothetical protein VYB59_05700 [Pseudomonadota bacterium]|nr:hypothetical protein [Pseudomonadota bacterium]